MAAKRGDSGLPPAAAIDEGQRACECVAIVWTQLQQIVLTAILLQEGWTLDVLFVCEEMPLLSSVRELSRKIVVLPSIMFSIKSIGRYRKAGRDLIVPVLRGMDAYRCLTWTLESPFARFVFLRPECKSIVLFEDGIGTYTESGRFSWGVGAKYAVTGLLISVLLWGAPSLRKTDVEADAVIFSLFPGPMPGSGIRRLPLRRDLYRRALLEANDSVGGLARLPEGAVLYLPSYFSDAGLMTEAEEVATYVDALHRFLDADPVPDMPVLWKPHPRANRECDARRMRLVSSQLDVAIRAIPAQATAEQVLLANREVNLTVVSSASSSIYALSALENPRHRLVCVDSPLLRSKLALMQDLYAFYARIGIEVIH